MENSKQQAFPCYPANVYEGLTKREYFAALAMQGFITVLQNVELINDYKIDKIKMAKMS